MSNYTLFLDKNTMEAKEYIMKIIEFCGRISSMISFSIHLSNYNLSRDEYSKAYHDIYNYYKNEDEKRRNDFFNNSDNKKTLLNKHKNIEGVMEYFDKLHKYDLIHLDEVKDLLLNFINRPANNTKGKNRFVKTSLPKENLLESLFTFNSHCTIGGLYKVYYFKINNKMINYLLDEGDLMKFYTLEETGFLEDPAFYSNDQRILSISTHERTTALFLSEEQYEAFRILKIPYIIG